MTDIRNSELREGFDMTDTVEPRLWRASPREESFINVSTGPLLTLCNQIRKTRTRYDKFMYMVEKGQPS